MAISQKSANVALLASFPFWIFVDTKSRLRIREVQVSQGTLRVYPPFRSAPANYLPTPRINLRNVPFPEGVAGGIAPTNTYARSMSAVPQLGLPPGTHKPIFYWGPAWQTRPRHFPMDSIRIDCLDGAGETNAQRFLTRMLRWLRHETRQWWISRSLDWLTTDVRNSIEIERSGRVTAKLRAMTGYRHIFGDETGVTDVSWTRCVAASVDGREVAVYHELLSDSRYHALSMQSSRSIMDAAIACELAKDLAYERIWNADNPGRKFKKGRVKQLAGYDLPKHIGRNLQGFAARSFELESPSDYAVIEVLWRSRREVAHGRLPEELDGEIKEDRRVAFLKELITAAENCVAWLDTLPST